MCRWAPVSPGWWQKDGEAGVEAPRIPVKQRLTMHHRGGNLGHPTKLRPPEVPK